MDTQVHYLTEIIRGAANDSEIAEMFAPHLFKVFQPHRMIASGIVPAIPYQKNDNIKRFATSKIA